MLSIFQYASSPFWYSFSEGCWLNIMHTFSNQVFMILSSENYFKILNISTFLQYAFHNYFPPKLWLVFYYAKYNFQTKMLSFDKILNMIQSMYRLITSWSAKIKCWPQNKTSVLISARLRIYRKEVRKNRREGGGVNKKVPENPAFLNEFPAMLTSRLALHWLWGVWKVAGSEHTYTLSWAFFSPLK